MADYRSLRGASDRRVGQRITCLNSWVRLSRFIGWLTALLAALAIADPLGTPFWLVFLGGFTEGIVIAIRNEQDQWIDERGKRAERLFEQEGRR